MQIRSLLGMVSEKSRSHLRPTMAIIALLLIGGFQLPLVAQESSAAVGEAESGASVQTPAESTTPENSTTPGDESTAAANTSPENAASATESLDPEAAAKKAQEEWDKLDWIGKVDAFFGKWIVGPMGAVLFFDFGTSTSLGVAVPFVVIWLLCGGVFLTLKMGFINIRGFKHAIDLVRGKYDDPNEPGEVSHFQALSSALSGTVGLGNIAGVAVAVGIGGPGATFWMILCGLLGMTTKFAECSLAVMYRRIGSDGTVLGGPMVYLRQGLLPMYFFNGLEKVGYKKLGVVLSVVFTILCIGGSLGGGNSYQIVQSLDAIRNDPNLEWLDKNPWIYGLVMVVAVGAVILGGIKSIGQTAGRIVPIMCLAYLIMALTVIFVHRERLPEAIQSIFTGAFKPEGVAGGFLGVLVIGVKRAVFSNEAGAGSAAIAHSAAKTDKPLSEGFVALLEPFIDTVVVCTLTALMIVVSGVLDDPKVTALAGANKGAQVTLIAVTGTFDWFRYVLYASVILFAYSTCISWSYYGERCFVYLFGPSSSLLYKILFLSFTFLGSIISAKNIMEFSDMLILSMAVPNLIGVFLLSGVVKNELQKYLADLKSGKMKH